MTMLYYIAVVCNDSSVSHRFAFSLAYFGCMVINIRTNRFAPSYNIICYYSIVDWHEIVMLITYNIHRRVGVSLQFVILYTTTALLYNHQRGFYMLISQLEL